MNDTQPMTTERFLALLNKADRTPEEQTELDAEIRRQAQVQQPKPEESARPEVQPETPIADAQPAETPAEQPQVVEGGTVSEQPAQAPYSLDQLEKETQDAVSYLKTQNRTLAVEMAVSAYTQAIYWVGLAKQGE